MRASEGKHWDEPLNSQLINAYLRRADAGLLEAPILLRVDPRWEPDAPQGWQYVMMAAASGGIPDLVTLALARGASAVEPIRSEWIGVDDGQLVTCWSEEPVYFWLARGNRRRKDDVPILRPIQAAVAGADPGCIRALAQAGADLCEALRWLASLRLNSVRLLAGIVLLETAHEDELDGRLARSWLMRGERWLIGRSSKRYEQNWGQVNQTYGRIGRLCRAYRVIQHISTEGLAFLL